jgi:RNA recognition motif-containing protein
VIFTARYPPPPFSSSLQGRVGADGLPKSRGFGFVEFSTHEAALAALRQINNNPLVFSAQVRDRCFWMVSG